MPLPLLRLGVLAGRSPRRSPPCTHSGARRGRTDRLDGWNEQSGRRSARGGPQRGAGERGPTRLLHLWAGSGRTPRRQGGGSGSCPSQPTLHLSARRVQVLPPSTWKHGGPDPRVQRRRRRRAERFAALLIRRRSGGRLRPRRTSAGRLASRRAPAAQLAQGATGSARRTCARAPRTRDAAVEPGVQLLARRAGTGAAVSPPEIARRSSSCIECRAETRARRPPTSPLRGAGLPCQQRYGGPFCPCSAAWLSSPRHSPPRGLFV
eukprot:scaffold508_cov554-Prasinococcus_capsulatus_cf.AAC.17